MSWRRLSGRAALSHDGGRSRAGDVASSLRGRLLIVVNDAPFFLSHRLPIAIEAKRRGYDVHIATPPSHRTRDIEAAGLTWHPIPLQ
jgi:hypothetical protein